MSERTYSEAEVARLQEAEVRAALKGLLRSLEAVRAQRHNTRATVGSHMAARIEGEIIGLGIAIQAIKRRVR